LQSLEESLGINVFGIRLQLLLQSGRGLVDVSECPETERPGLLDPANGLLRGPKNSIQQPQRRLRSRLDLVSGQSQLVANQAEGFRISGFFNQSCQGSVDSFSRAADSDQAPGSRLLQARNLRRERHGLIKLCERAIPVGLFQKAITFAHKIPAALPEQLWSRRRGLGGMQVDTEILQVFSSLHTLKRMQLE
jgi:hypothetical protein